MKRGGFTVLGEGKIYEGLEGADFTANDILHMLKELPDACCVFKIVTDPFGTVRDMQFLFVNEKYASLVGKPTAELVGSNYYEVVSNRDEDWIRLSYQAAFMRQSVINRTFNTQFNKWFEFWAVPVYKKGFCAFIIHDVTAEKRKEETTEIVSNSNNIIIECAKILSSSDLKKGLKSCLEILGTKINADRVYIVEANRGEPGAVYEWSDRLSGKGLPNKKDFEGIDIFTMWDKQLAGNNVVEIHDAAVVKAKNEVAYEKFLAGKITRYMLAAIKDKDNVLGYLIADNHDQNLDINVREVFETVSIFISEELRNYNMAQEMIYMSTHDVLTDLGNRHSFNSAINVLEGLNATLGICFIDINGLKAINDEKGHESGDDVIREVGTIVSTIFKKKYCYRIGGDEFVAMVPHVDQIHFEEQVEKLRKRSKKTSMAIGAVWKDNAKGIEEMINEADKLMYNDKASFYSDSNDRRH